MESFRSAIGNVISTVYATESLVAVMINRLKFSSARLINQNLHPYLRIWSQKISFRSAKTVIAG